MTDVFISYSRRDKVFVRRLFDALEAKGRESWVDWESIPYSAEWWREIQTGIEAADTLIFVITSHSLGSRICNDEFAYALKLNKRIIPVIRREIYEREMAGVWFNQSWEQQARANWETLKKLNWLFMRRKDECECQYDDEQQVVDPACDGPDCDYDDFGKAFGELVETLETDIEHVKTHTRLLVRAQEWESKVRNRSYLLSGDDLHNAEIWLAVSGGKEPKPTQLHTQYIVASRSASTARQRTTVGALAFGFVVALALALLSFVLFQRSENNLSLAVVAQATSERRADEARSLALAAAAQQSQTENQVTALALAVEANQMIDPPSASQRILAALAYGPGASEVFAGDPSPVIGIVIRPDEQSILSASSDGTFRLWDIAAGSAIQSLPADVPIGTIWNCVSFGPDGLTALTGAEDGTITLWDLQTGAAKQMLYTGVRIDSLALSPNGNTAAAGLFDGTVILWDLPSDREDRLVREPRDDNFSVIASVSFSPDGQNLLSASADGTMTLWNIDTTDELSEFDLTFSGFTTRSAVFHPNGEWILSASDDAQIRLWDIETRTVLQDYRAENTTTPEAIFNPDGTRILASVGNGSLLVWNTETGELLDTLTANNIWVPAIAFSPDGFTAVSASEEGIPILWDIAGNRDRLFATDFRPNLIYAMAIRPDGQPLIATSEDNNLIIENVATDEHLNRFEVDADTISTVAFSPDAQTILSGSTDGTLTLWDMTTSEPFRSFIGHQAGVNHAAFSPDGQNLLSASSDATLILWNLETGEFIRNFTGHQARINDTAFSPDGRTALSASDDGTVILWDVETATVRYTLVGHSAPVNVVSFNHDGTLALSGSNDQTLKLWDLLTGRLLRTFEGQNGPITSGMFSPDDSMILSSATAYTIFSAPTAPLMLWDVATGQVLRTFGENTFSMYDAVLAEDGKTALSVSLDNIVTLWRVDTLDELVNWTYSNRFIPELTCEQRALYGVDVQCDEIGIFPTRTPFPTLTPASIPSNS